jgi:hypothetical protein
VLSDNVEYLKIQHLSGAMGDRLKNFYCFYKLYRFLALYDQQKIYTHTLVQVAILLCTYPPFSVNLLHDLVVLF